MKITKACKVCGIAFQTDDWKEKYGRGVYCSRACYKIGYRAQIVANNPNPPKRVSKQCETCGVIMEVPPSIQARKRFCSKECLNAWQRSIIGTNHPLYTSIVKRCEWCEKEYACKKVHKERSRFCSRQCQGAYTAYNFPKGQTTIEAAIAALLDDLDLSYFTQKPMGPFLCDFMLSGYKLIIECDGIYWHSSEKQKAKDANKDSWLTSHGYQVLRLTSTEIEERIDWCRAQIIMRLIPS